MTWAIPGTSHTLHEDRDDQGRLVSLVAGGRQYLWQEEDGRHYDGGVVTFEAAVGRALARSVRTERHGSWVEQYRLDAEGRPSHIDGVDVLRDARRRVVGCGDWAYTYRDTGLSSVTSTCGERRVGRDVDGRALRVREGRRTHEYRYDAQGERHDASDPPSTWQRDDLGRLWTVIGPDGEVEKTYLWDGFACLGRIDGPPGDPLSAVFSLDPTCTPVRVITADGVTRIPRDAFGEGLLAHPDVPGLFGGAQHSGQVHYAARSLDPRTGMFLQPDPWDGREEDPRRAEGYRGTLLVERGSYTVAMDDPVGRMDPTGEASVGLYISTFTWSWQNNLVGWLAMDFFLNLWGSLFGAIGNKELLDRFGDFEHLTSSDHIGATAVRRDGIWSIRDENGVNTNAWTFQHMAWASAEHVNELLDVQVVDPGAAFTPELYGSVLHVRPGEAAPRALSGTRVTTRGRYAFTAAGTQVRITLPAPAVGARLRFRRPAPLGNIDVTVTARDEVDATLLTVTPAVHADPTLDGTADDWFLLDTLGVADGWTRTASRDDDGVSRAQAMWEGCIVPNFPGSAIHLDRSIPRVRGTIASTLAELVHTGGRGFGTLEERTVLVVNATGIGLAPSDLVYYGNGTGIISRVLNATEADGSTNVRLEDDASAVTVAGARLREVEARTEEDVPRGTAPEHLNLVGSSSTGGGAAGDDYDVGDFLRFSDGGAVLGAGRVVGFAAEITIDSDLPAGIVAPATVRTMTVTAGGDAELTDDPLRVLITTGPPPANGNAIAVTVGGTPIPVFLDLQDAADPRLFTVDRPLYTGASQAGTVVPWERLTSNVELSSNAPLPAGTTLTYGPSEVRQAPDSGFVSFESVGGRALRRVTGRAFDSLVLGAPVPAGPNPVHVERFTAVAGGVDQAIASAELEATLSVQPGQELFAAGADTERLVVHLVGSGGVAIGAGNGLALPAASVPAFAGNRMTVPHAPGTRRDGNLTAGQPVILTPTGGGALELNAVSAIWVTLPLDRVTGITNDDLRVAWLVDGSSRYDGVRVDDVTVTALPNLAGVGRVQMPQFWLGEIVRVAYDLAGVATRRYGRVAAVDGSTVTLAESPPIDAGATAITVTRMNPADPDNGSAWAGLEASVIPGAAGANDQLRVRVWRPGDLAATLPIAIVDGTTAHPAVVIDGNVTLEIDFAAPPTAAAYAVSLMPAAEFSLYMSRVVREGDAYVIPNFPPATGTPGNLVYALTYGESTPVHEAELTPGTALAPVIENHEVDRRQSLVDHELVHTLQSARWGPMMLCFLPYQMLLLDRAIGTIPGVDSAEFSAYAAATLERRGSFYQLTIPSGGAVTFEEGNAVEISLQHVRFHARLAEAEEGAFPLIADAFSELAVALEDRTPTPVQVRRQHVTSTGADVGIFFGRLLSSLLHLGTHGGVLNATVGWTYGGLFTLLARALYTAGRAARSSTDYPGEVIEGGAALRLTSPAAIEAFRAEERISVQGPYTVVRAIASREEDGALLRLVGSLPSQWTTVRVLSYSTTNPDSNWDWHSYYPASVPDPARPAEIRVQKVDGSPSLEFRDEVWLKNGTYIWIAKVLTVQDEGASLLVNINKPVAASITEHEFQLAKGDRGTPGFAHETAGEGTVSAVKNIPGFLSEDLMNLVGAGWMRWVFNPWGEALGRLHAAVPDDTFWWKFLRVFTHIASTSMSTYGWTIASPALGWLIWDRELTGSGPHMSYTEQEAASKSGDMYSPAGRLFGQFEVEVTPPVAGAPTGTFSVNTFIYVGDVIRYVFYSGGRLDKTTLNAQQDRPGVSFDDEPRVGLDVAVDHGRALPDLLYAKDFANPYAFGNPEADEQNFSASAHGWRPVSDRLQRASSIHLAFSRPSADGGHLVTVRQDVGSRAEGIEATDRYQPLFFNVPVRDITATLAGQPVTNDGTVRMVRGQQARFRVAENNGRNYGLALLNPGNGAVLRLDGEQRVVAQAQAGTEGAQIDRVHEAEALPTHLQRAIRVPVREFDIEVLEDPPVVSVLPADAAGLFGGLAANPNPGGSVFVVVPSPIASALEVDDATLGGLPAPAITVVTTPEALVDFLGDGAIYEVTFASDVPAASVNMGFRVTVQGAAATIDMDLTVTLDPA